MPQRTWVPFTDGAYSGDPGPGSGVVLVSPDGEMHEGLEYLGKATNDVAGLTGILRAIESIPGRCAPAIVVSTDGPITIRCRKGLEGKSGLNFALPPPRSAGSIASRLPSDLA